MADPVALYDGIVQALRADDDSVTTALFAPGFVTHEDPGVPYGGVIPGGQGFVDLRRKVISYWQLKLLYRCGEPGGRHMSAFLSAKGHPGGPLDGIETFVNVSWTFDDNDKALEARVFYFNTPPIAAALAHR
ncbi:MAG: hypothetical protein EON57_05500 [Alphaproteobacteria bacterium]|jgi:hypothetical protein|nr:MAG: hypothetical protein EON57_05500 [Alphaproteobacteria bacterium]